MSVLDMRMLMESVFNAQKVSSGMERLALLLERKLLPLSMLPLLLPPLLQLAPKLKLKPQLPLLPLLMPLLKLRPLLKHLQLKPLLLP